MLASLGRRAGAGEPMVPVAQKANQVKLEAEHRHLCPLSSIVPWLGVSQSLLQVKCVPLPTHYRCQKKYECKVQRKGVHQSLISFRAVKMSIS